MNALATKFVLLKKWNNHCAYIIEVCHFITIHMMVVGAVFFLEYYTSNLEESIYVTK